MRLLVGRAAAAPIMSHEAVERNQLKANIGALYALQAANYLIPLITLPYLVRVLGAEKFGLLAFAFILIEYFGIVTDYGFNLSASRRIAVCKNQPERISEIFCSTMLAKLCLAVLCFAVLALLLTAVPHFRAESVLYLAAFLQVVGNAIFPVWYFHGMERMKYITLLHVAARLVGLVALIVLVQSEDDYVVAALIQGGTPMLAGVLGFLTLRSYTQLRFYFPPLGTVVEAYKDGWHIFLSRVSIALYTNSSGFVLGLLTTPTLVGYYVMAEKVVKIACNGFAPIYQAAYPRTHALAAQSRALALQFIRANLRWLGLAALVLSAVLFLAADLIVRLLFGEAFMAAALLLKIMAVLPFVMILVHIFGVQTMLTFGLEKDYSRVTLAAGLLHLAVLTPLILRFGAAGAAGATVITQIVMAATLGYFLTRHGIPLFRPSPEWK